MFEGLLFDAVVAYFGIGLAGLGHLVIGTSMYDVYAIKRQKLRQLHPYAKQFRYRPHITVVIPVHNASDTITACLNSVFKNAYRSKYDVIIIDYGSTDQTKKIVRAFIVANPKKPIRLVAKPGATNMLAVTNKIIKKTSATEMILTLDATHIVGRLTLRQLGQHYDESADGNLIPDFQIITQPSLLSLMQQYVCVFSSSYKKLVSNSANRKALPLGTAFRPKNIVKLNEPSLRPKSIYMSDVKIYIPSLTSYDGWLSNYSLKKRTVVEIDRLSFSVAHKRMYLSIKHWNTYNVLVAMNKCMRTLTPLAVAYFIYLALYYDQPVWLALVWVCAVLGMVWSIWTNSTVPLKTKGRLSFFVPIIPGLLYLLNIGTLTLKLMFATKNLAKIRFL